MELGPLLPFGFLGTSMEWGGVGFYGRNTRDWAKLLAVLGPNPVIRIGGATQDLLAQVRVLDLAAVYATITQGLVLSRY
jgi:hypothetical protein